MDFDTLRSVPAMLGAALRELFAPQPQQPPGIPGVSGASIRQDPATVEQNRRDFENYQSSSGGVRG